MGWPRRQVIVGAVVVGVVAMHAAIHGMGVASALGWPGGIGAAGAAGATLWFVAGALTLDTAVLLATRSRSWWAVGAAAAVVSQVAVGSAWPDAWAGTVVNAGLLAASVQAFASAGPWGLPADYRRRLDRWHAASDIAPVRAAAASDVPETVSEADLAGLPAPVARYVRRCGVVGRPRVTGFHARISGRIRSGPDQPWMPFAGEQANT
jgi:hypothetical protein